MDSLCRNLISTQTEMLFLIISLEGVCMCQGGGGEGSCDTDYKILVVSRSISCSSEIDDQCTNYDYSTQLNI